jgi:hypothetical protein
MGITIAMPIDPKTALEGIVVIYGREQGKG